MRQNKKYDQKFYKKIEKFKIDKSKFIDYKFIKMCGYNFLSDYSHRFSKSIDFYDSIHTETFVNSVELSIDLSNSDILIYILSIIDAWNQKSKINTINIIHSLTNFHNIKIYTDNSLSKYLLEDIESYKEPVAEITNKDYAYLIEYYMELR